MKTDIKKQILMWKEELAKQIHTRNNAKKVFDEAVININSLQGGIQFGELLLKSYESSNPPSSKEEPKLQSKKEQSN